MTPLVWVAKERLAILPREEILDWSQLHGEGVRGAIFCCDRLPKSTPEDMEILGLSPGVIRPESLFRLSSFVHLTNLMKRSIFVFSDRSTAWSAIITSFALVIEGWPIEEASRAAAAACPSCRWQDLRLAIERTVLPLLRMVPEEAVQFSALTLVMRTLRRRCPWDRKQTHQSLTKYLLEESWELVEAVRREDPQALRGELGDVLLQVVFHAVIAEEKGWFTLAQAVKDISCKLVRRHPHVFVERYELTPGGVERQWELIKDTQEHRSQEDLNRRYMPALMRAERIQEVASQRGFDWRESAEVMAKVGEELHELEQAMNTGISPQISEEIGDMLFTLVNLCRFLRIHPEETLHLATDKFLNRYQRSLTLAAHEGKRTEEMTLEELDCVWEQAKIDPQSR